MSEKNSFEGAPHPEREPKYPGALTAGNLARVFSGCADLEQRKVQPGLMYGAEAVTLLWLDGLVDGAALSEDVLPMSCTLGYLRPFLLSRQAMGVVPAAR